MNKYEELDRQAAEDNKYTRLDNAQSGFVPTIKRTGGKMLSGVGIAAEDIAGKNVISDYLRRKGEDIVAENPAAIGSLRDIVEQPGMAVKEAVGQMVPQIGAGVLGRMAGGALAGRAFGPAGVAVGGLVGGLAPIFTQEYGGIREDQQAQNIDDKGRALLAAGGATALEFLGPEGRIISKGLQPAAGRTIRDIATGAAKDVGVEAATEALQSGVEQIGAYRDPLTLESLEESAVSGIMGGIGGGIVGGGRRALEAVLPAQQPLIAPQVPQVPPAPPAGPLAQAASIAQQNEAAAPTRHVPFATQEAAQKRADSMTETTGEQHIAAPHPENPARFAALPATAVETPGKTPVETPAETAAPMEAAAMIATPTPARVDGHALAEADKLAQLDELQRDSHLPKAEFDNEVQRRMGLGEPAQTAFQKAFQEAQQRRQIDLAAHEAATSPLNERPEPTPAQQKASNYRMGHQRIQGLNISIENPAGSTRSGTDADGKPWQTKMPAHYGYIRGTEAADSDKLDVYVGPYPGRPTVFVVDQKDPKSGEFDEHKAMLGFDNIEEAEAAYRAAFTPEWQGFGGITPLPMADFKQWIKDPANLKTPLTQGAQHGQSTVATDVEQIRPAGDEQRAGAEQGGENPQLEKIAPSESSQQAESGLPAVGLYQDGNGEAAPVAQPGTANTAERGPTAVTAVQPTEKALPANTVRGGAEAIGAVFDHAQSKSPVKKAVRFGTVDEQQGKAIQAATGLDVSGYEHSVDNYAIRHALKSHGDPATEAARGQAAITKEDFAKIPDIVASYDTLESVGTDSKGLALIRYGKRYNGLTYYVEEVRDKRGELALKTLWKTRTTKPDVAPEAPAALTSETLGRNPPQGEASIAPSAAGQAPLAIESLTDKAIIVKGDTRTHKDRIRAAGGIWNKKHTGWIFPKTREAQVRERLADLLQAQAPVAAPASSQTSQEAAPEQSLPHSEDVAALAAQYGMTWNDAGEGYFKSVTDVGFVSMRATDKGVKVVWSLLNPHTGSIGDHRFYAGAGKITETYLKTQLQELEEAANKAKAKAEPAAKTPETKAPAKKQDWTEIGKNAIGQTLYEDQNGVRSYIETGVRLTESVSLRPTRQGMQIEVDVANRDSRYKTVAETTKAEAAPPTPKADESEQTRQARADLDAALGDLGDILGKPFRSNIVPTDEAKLLPVLTRVMDAAFRLGYHKFKDAARFVLTTIRDKFGDDAAKTITLDHLQGAYIGMAGKYKDQGADTKQAVIDVASLDALQVEPVETPLTPADNAPKEETNADTPDRRSPSTVDRTLVEGLPAEPAPAVEPAGDAAGVRPGKGRSDADRVRDGGTGVDAATDAAEALGNRRGDAGVPHPTAADVAATGGGRAANGPEQRDYRLQPGGLTREGSWRDTAARNIDLIELARRIDAEKRPATPAEQAQLVKYVGFGAGEIRNKLFPVVSSYTQEREPDRLIWPAQIADRQWRALAERLDQLPRDWQKSLLRSTQYAHYTSESVIRSIWQGVERLGFTGGRVLEPGMGIGSFALLMPSAVHPTSTYTGIEYDAPTALIARLLLPQQNIKHADFVQQKLPRDFFDLAIGNPPFARTVIKDDPEYAKREFSLHDYFFAKALDRVRPGGLLVFVTSRYTMDKQTDKARRYLAERADLLAAIRLPQTAFRENAGTDVVTDVIFLRKRAATEAPAGQPWQGVGELATKDGPIMVNEYFVAHPEMLLGQPRIAGNRDDQDRYISGLRPGEPTIVSYDESPAALEAAFATAIERLPANVYSTLKADTETLKRETRERDFDPKTKREGGLYLAKDGEVMQVNDGSGMALADKIKLSTKDKAWLTGYVGLRDLVQAARMAQLHDADWMATLRKLNKAYDAFRKTHGPILDFRVQVRKTTNEDGEVTETPTRIFKNTRLLREDYDQALVKQLEDINEAGEIVKGPFLTGRTIGKPAPRVIKTLHDALAVSLDERGRLDLEDLAQRLGESREATISALGDLIYETPAGQWQLADEYLSGHVVDKLNEAKTAADVDARFARNVAALEKAQPAPLGPTQIVVPLGAGWVPDKHVSDFARDILGAGDAIYDAKTESWRVAGGNLRSERRLGKEYGTADRSASEILEAVLNNRQLKVTRTTEDKKTVVDEAATAQVNDIAKKMKQRFRVWVWTDAERAGELIDLYNRQYNNIAPRRFDGSHLTLPGVSLRFQLHPHQKRAIWRVIQTGNTYLAHAVGAGKTIEMIAAGMEQRRLGLINKPLYVVPNHMLEQFSNEFMELYPLANILVADDENFSAERRRQFIAATAMNNPDAVVITHSAFGRIGVKPETVEPLRDAMVTDLKEALADTKKDERVRRSQLEQQIEAVERRFDSIVNAAGKDKTVLFEEMGVDFVFVDEAHEFRKLDFNTNRKIKGIDPNGSRRALDIYVKTRWLEQQRPGRSMAFASGTPVTNTMGELYTLMRFFSEEQMDRERIGTFDGWANMFGDVATSLEPNAAGNYEPVERFAKFINIAELMKRVRTFMDVLTSDQLGAAVKRPDLEGGRPQMILAPATESLKTYMTKVLQPRIEVSKKWKPSPGQRSNPDPIIAIITDGRFATLDPRFFDRSTPATVDSKLNRMADEVVADYQAIKDLEYVGADGKPDPLKGGAQVVFFNLGFGAQSQINRGFNARAAFNQRLVAGGIPRDAIAWFEDADTDAKKEAVFSAMRSGRIKVLIGSAKKMGTGVNVQRRLKVLHYFDAPWYPADVEQPHGRILRQGNQNASVRIKWYATKGTYDEQMWNSVARKQRFIDQAFAGDESLRTMEDISEAGMYELAAALSSGDPRVIQLAGLKQDVERLEMLQVAHVQEQVNLRAKSRELTNAQDNNVRYIERLNAGLKEVGDEYVRFDSGHVGDAEYDNRADFGAALKRAYNAAVSTYVGAGGFVPLGKLNGKFTFGAAIQVDKVKDKIWYAALAMQLAGQPYDVEQGLSFGVMTDDGGLVTKMTNKLNNVSRSLEETKLDQLRLATERRQVEKRIGAPFEYMQDLAEKTAERARLESELAGSSKGTEGDFVPYTALDQWEGEGGLGEKPKSAEDKGQPLFSRRGEGKSVTRAEVRERVNAISKQWRNAPAINIVQAAVDLPAALQADLLSRDASKDVEGLFHNGEVYLIADNIASLDRAEAVLLHETMGHYGLRALLGDNLNAELNRLYVSNPSIREEAGKRMAQFGYSRAVATEEVLAEMAERGEKLNGWQRFVAFVRNALRSLGFKMGMSDNDVRKIIADAGKMVREGRNTVTARATPALASRDKPMFYSELEAKVASHKQSVASPQQWTSLIKNLPGVKADEVTFSGVNEWLQLQEGKVTREALVDYLKAGGVRVEETQLGRTKSQLEELLSPEDITVRSVDELQWELSTPVGRTLKVGKGTVSTVEEAKAYGVRYFNSHIRERNQEKRAAADTTKFSQYQLPGGENYHELLLTLPVDESRRKALLDERTKIEQAGKLLMGHPERQSAADRVDEINFELIESAGPAERFRSPHFSERNIIGHVRFNERTDADGKKVLFIEELQSDWAQKGKKDGFKDDSAMQKIPDSKNDLLALGYRFQVNEAGGFQWFSPNGDFVAGSGDAQKALQTALEAVGEPIKQANAIRLAKVVPSAPFVTKTEAWTGLLLKRMIRYAAENGFDRIAWTTGEQQAARYDLSKHLNTFEYEPIRNDQEEVSLGTSSGKYYVNQSSPLFDTRAAAEQWARENPDSGLYEIRATDKNGKEVISEEGINLNRIEELVGKEIAQKVEAGEGEDTGGAYRAWKTLSGLDLKVGGEGMRAYYDKIVPNVANDVLKKLGGGRVGEVRFIPEAYHVGGRSEDVSSPGIQPGFDLTPALRDKALGGLPLFSRAPREAFNTLRDGAQQWLATVSESDRSINPLMRSVNTQYHKAETLAKDGKPEFKRVFDLGQRFLSDTTLLAAQAAQLAPNILHQPRSLRDVAGGAQEVDLNAIERPLNDGTLYGGGDPAAGVRWSDKQLRDRYQLSDKQIALYHEYLEATAESVDIIAKAQIAAHAKQNDVDFDADYSLEDMAAMVVERLDDALTDAHLALEYASDQQRINDEAADLVDQDMPHMADQLRIDAERTAREIEAKIARLEKTILDINAIAARGAQLRAAGYKPLMRFGEHTVTAHDEDGQVAFYGMYEGNPLLPRSGEMEAKKVAAALQEENPEWTVKTGLLSKEAYKLYAGVNLEALQLFADHMDAEAKEPYQEYLRQAVNNRSAMKRMIHRQGTPGFSPDVRRTLAQFVLSNGRLAASQYHLTDMRKAAEAIPHQQGDIKDEAVKLHEYLTNPQEEASKLRGFLFFNYIGGSIASAIVNLTQLPTVTAPYLSQHTSYANGVAELLNAAKLSTQDPAKIPGALGDALRKAEADGVTAPQEIYQLMALASNSFFAGAKTARVALQAWGKFFSAAEQFNRRATFIAAYRIAVANGKSDKDAFAFAETAVTDTQFIYNKGNRPNWARGAIGATVFTFKQFQIAYLELLKRLPMKQRAMMLGTLVMFAGMGGLPFEEDLEDLIDTLGQWLGFATNAKRSIRRGLEGAIGEGATQAVLHGVSAGLPFDVSARMGMGNLLPATAILKPSELHKSRDVAEAVGPVGSLILSVGDMLEALATGHYERAAIAAMPTAARNLHLGVKMGAKGYAEDAAGRKTLPVTETEAAFKAMGFQPTTLAEFREVKQGLQQQRNLLAVKQEELNSRWAEAIRQRDMDGVDAARRSLVEWNHAHPDMPLRFDPAAIRRRVMQAEMDGDRRFIKGTPQGMRRQAIEELR